MNWWKISEGTRSELRVRLEGMRPIFAAKAQEVYDGWNQDESGHDDELGHGGICHLIADAIGQVLSESGIDTVDIHWDDINHVSCVAYDDDEGYIIDVPCSLYERGGWYNWKKIRGVKFEWSDITISRISRGDVQGILDYGQ
jgi:hypothetical protein